MPGQARHINYANEFLIFAVLNVKRIWQYFNLISLAVLDNFFSHDSKH